ncbi:aminoglycoside phosphotransferase family protein [Desulfocastanea catecholica]
MHTEQLSDRDILRCAGEMLAEKGMLTSSEMQPLVTGASCRKIDSDGSTRRFWRMQRDNAPFCLIAAPAATSPAELAESRSAWKIGSHLHQKGVPVPQLFGWDNATGVLLFEDLGDIRLHDLVAKKNRTSTEPRDSAIDFYRSALEHLAVMQCRGAEGFDPSWCWDNCQYDYQLMIEKESGYFLRAFWQGLLGHEVDAGVEDELQDIARRAGEAPAGYFLHRDFQSRNIMIKEGAVRFIDFQGGRLGPLGYDLASLLIDPYSRLSLSLQEELLTHYLQAIHGYATIEEAVFKRQFSLLALQRNMQIVGAFSFLSQVRQKVFFLNFIQPSLVSLKNRLEEPLFKDYTLLRTMVNRGLKELVPA